MSLSDALVKSLRSIPDAKASISIQVLGLEAANEIERLRASQAKVVEALPALGQIYYELERARDNLNARYLGSADESAGRSARAIQSALCVFDTIRAALAEHGGQT